MEEVQSLNYNSFETELEFDLSQLDGRSFHADESEYSKILEDEMNNGTKSKLNSETELSWLTDFTSVGNSERFGHIDDEMVIGANEGFPDKTINEDLSNGLGLSHWINPLEYLLENSAGFTDSKTADTNNGQLIGDDFVLAKHLDPVSENKITPKKRKATLTNSDDIDGQFVEAFDERDQNIVKLRKDRPAQSTHFETRKSKRSSIVDNGEKENLECIQADAKRKRTSGTVGAGEFSTTNSTSSNGQTQLFDVAGRGRNRNARTRNRRSETRFSTDFEDLSPVSSPEAEVPLSPSNTSELIGDDELITLDTKDLNRRVKYLPKATVQDIKHRRRTLKNRGYARSCREKKIDETCTLQRSNADLEKELASIKLELQIVKLQRDDWKQNYEQLASKLKKRGYNH